MGFSHFAGNLRYYRQLTGLGQRELARRAGTEFSQSYISALERGLRPSTETHLQALADVLGVTAEALVRKPRTVQTLAAVRRVIVIPGPAAARVGVPA